MSNSNIYPLVIPPGCGYPQIVPARARSKSTWLPYGRRVVSVVSLRAGESESYFRHRNVAPVREAHALDEQSENSNHSTSESTFYPGMINAITQKNIT